MDETRDSVLYLVDASQSMASSGALDSALTSVCEAIRDTAKQGVARYDAGVILFNVDTPNGSETLLKMGEPAIADLKSMIRLVQNKPSSTIKSTHASGANLLNLIRLAKSAMNSLHTKSYRRVVLITNEDNPFKENTEEDVNESIVASNLIADLVASPSVLVPIFVNPPDHRFDTTKFWINVDYVPSFWASMEIMGDNLKPIDVETLNSRHAALIVSRSVRKFSSLRGTLKLNKLSIGFMGYNIVRTHAGLPSAYKIGISSLKNGFDQREILKSNAIFAKAGSGAEIEEDKKPEFVRKFKLSSSKDEELWTVDVSNEDLEELKRFDDDNDDNNNNSNRSSVEIENFVSVETLRGIHDKYGYVGHSILLVPSDDRLENSTKAFASLHRSMMNKKVAAIALLNHSSKASSHAPQLGVLYAFDPQSNPAPKLLEPSASMGLYFVPLPYSNDVREIPSLVAGEITPQSSKPDPVAMSLKASLSALIKKFKLPNGYDPKKFPNPSYSLFAYILEHLALSLPLEYKENGDGYKIIVEPQDPTLPRYAKIDQLFEKVGKVIVKQLSAFSNDEFAVFRPASTRKYADSSELPDAKKAKVDDEVTISAARDALNNDQLSKWTVPKLKMIAKQMGDTGEVFPSKKADLLTYIGTYMSSV